MTRNALNQSLRSRLSRRLCRASRNAGEERGWRNGRTLFSVTKRWPQTVACDRYVHITVHAWESPVKTPKHYLASFKSLDIKRYTAPLQVKYRRSDSQTFRTPSNSIKEPSFFYKQSDKMLEERSGVDAINWREGFRRIASHLKGSALR